MCYALSISASSAAQLADGDRELYHFGHVATSYMNDDYPQSTEWSKKRAASPVAEGPSKRAKRSPEKEVKALIEVAQGNKQKLVAQVARIKQLEADLEEKTDECQRLSIEKVGLELQNEDSTAQLKAERANAKKTAASHTKRALDNEKAKVDKKFAKQKEQSDHKLEKCKEEYTWRVQKEKQRHLDLQQSKDEAWEKKLEEQAVKHRAQLLVNQEKIDEAVEGQREEKAKLKEERKAVTQLKKDLKREQQEEIKKLKPEHSKIVSDLQKAAKEREAKTELLQSDHRKIEKELTHIRAQLEHESVSVAKSTADNKNLRNLLEVADGEILTLKYSVDKMEQDYRKRLDHEHKRWKQTWDNNQEQSARVVEHQRVAFDLRNINDRRLRDNHELKAKVAEQTAEIEKQKVELEEQKAELKKMEKKLDRCYGDIKRPSRASSAPAGGLGT